SDGNSLYLVEVISPERNRLHILDLHSMKQTDVPDSPAQNGTTASPDGKYLAAASVDGQKLLLFDTASRQWAELVQASVNAIHWSADSQSIYFDSQSSAEPAIYRIHLADRKLETIASLKDIRRVVLPFQAWMGLSPDGAPLLMRDTGTQEVYALDFDA